MNPETARPERNDPCHCGSGRKYKQCCLEKDEAEARAVRTAAAAEAPASAAVAGTEAGPTARKAAPKRPTEQPWKRSQAPLFRRQSSPRKVGGS